MSELDTTGTPAATQSRLEELQTAAEKAGNAVAARAIDALLERIAKAGGEPISDELRPLAEKYAPALVQFTTKQAIDWLELATANPAKAYREVIERMPPEAVINEWDKLNDEWAQANADNAAAIAKQKAMVAEIATAFTRGLAKVMLSLVGL